MWAGGGGQQNLRGALAGRDQGRRVCGVQRGRWSKQGQRQRGAPDGSSHVALARGLFVSVLPSEFPQIDSEKSPISRAWKFQS